MYIRNIQIWSKLSLFQLAYLKTYTILAPAALAGLFYPFPFLGVGQESVRGSSTRIDLISLQEVGVYEDQHLESYFECGVIL